jgi:hypothetical protein
VDIQPRRLLPDGLALRAAQQPVVRGLYNLSNPVDPERLKVPGFNPGNLNRDFLVSKLVDPERLRKPPGFIP